MNSITERIRALKQSWSKLVVFSLLMFSFFLIFESCKTANQVWMPTHEQLIASSDVVQQSDAESLRRGRILAVTECASCHRQYWPSEYSSQKWPSILQKMGKRASLDQNQINDLIQYHVAASRAFQNREPLEDHHGNSMIKTN